MSAESYERSRYGRQPSGRICGTFGASSFPDFDFRGAGLGAGGAARTMGAGFTKEWSSTVRYPVIRPIWRSIVVIVLQLVAVGALAVIGCIGLALLGY
jgi:hypothetical protein